MATRMRTIRTRAELERVVAETPHLYVRVSRGPAADRRMGCSTNHASGRREAGLSVNAVTDWRSVTEYAYLLIGQTRARVWLLTGREVGRGGDNEPLLDPATWRPVATLARELVDELVREADREFIVAEARRKSLRHNDGDVFEVWGARFRRLAAYEVERV